MKQEKYRFDNAYEVVYRYNEQQKAYVCIGNYYLFEITKKTSRKRAIELVEEFNF